MKGGEDILANFPIDTSLKKKAHSAVGGCVYYGWCTMVYYGGLVFYGGYCMVWHGMVGAN